MSGQTTASGFTRQRRPIDWCSVAWHAVPCRSNGTGPACLTSIHGRNTRGLSLVEARHASTTMPVGHLPGNFPATLRQRCRVIPDVSVDVARRHWKADRAPAARHQTVHRSSRLYPPRDHVRGRMKTSVRSGRNSFCKLRRANMPCRSSSRNYSFRRGFRASMIPLSISPLCVHPVHVDSTSGGGRAMACRPVGLCPPERMERGWSANRGARLTRVSANRLQPAGRAEAIRAHRMSSPTTTPPRGMGGRFAA